MPPRPKHRKSEIIAIAFDHVRKHGWANLTARFLAEKLQSSTKPIYSHFKSMKDLEEEVVKKALEVLHQYITARRSDDLWLDHGIGYILFAREEKHLFRCINDEKHWVLRKKYGERLWESLAEDLSDYPAFRGLEKHRIDAIRNTRWVYVHGLASLTNILALEEYDEARITELIKNLQDDLCLAAKTRLDPGE
ncbi:MAG: TetR/AcrR family transcriptional regulator [Desulfobacterales bacterium]|nr:TetR/AcrR family transcriptional regulator [Desulfobacterales bacterium]